MTNLFNITMLSKTRIALVFSIIFIGLLSLGVNAKERLYVPEFTVFGKAATPSDAIAVEALLQEFKKAWSKQDTNSLMDLYAEDIEWINAYARMFRGHKELSLFLENVLFPNFKSAVSKGEINNMKPISLRFLGSDVAVFHGYTDGQRGKSVIEGRDFRRTHFHFVMHKENDKWLFVHKTISDARGTG